MTKRKTGLRRSWTTISFLCGHRDGSRRGIALLQKTSTKPSNAGALRVEERADGLTIDTGP